MTLDDVLARIADDGRASGASEGRFDPDAYRRALARGFGTPCDAVSVVAHPALGGASKMIVPSHPSASTRLVYLHGGGMVAGGWQSHAALVGWLAELSGLTTYFCDYRLAPEHPFPAAMDDAVAAVRSIRQSEPECTIALAGDSAGCALALAVCQVLERGGEAAPSAVAMLSPMLSFDPETSRYVGETAVGAKVAAAYVGAASVQDPLVSPFHAELRDWPAILIHSGSVEIFCDEARSFADSLRAKGAPVAFEEWPDLPHVWHRFVPDFAPAREALGKAAMFLRDASGNPAN